jgi:hypothetical protein
VFSAPGKAPESCSAGTWSRKNKVPHEKKIVDFLNVEYLKLLELTLFISPNTFLGFVELHAFGIKILGTLGDALIPY